MNVEVETCRREHANNIFCRMYGDIFRLCMMECIVCSVWLRNSCGKDYYECSIGQYADA